MFQKVTRSPNIARASLRLLELVSAWPWTPPTYERARRDPSICPGVLRSAVCEVHLGDIPVCYADYQTR